MAALPENGMTFKNILFLKLFFLADSCWETTVFNLNIPVCFCMILYQDKYKFTVFSCTIVSVFY